MLLQNGNSHRVDSDLLAGSQKKFISRNRSHNARSETETRSRQKLCCQNDIISKNCCRAQQRLTNLTTKSKIKDVQPKPPVNSSVQQNSLDPKPFIYKVRNYDHINALKSEGKLSNSIFIHNGSFEYYPKDPIYDRNFTTEKKIQNNEKLNNKTIKEKLNNASQTSDTDLVLSSTVYDIKENNQDNYKNSKKCDKVTEGDGEKIKAHISSENDPLCVINAKSTLEKKELAVNSLTSFQQWFVKNEPAVSTLCSGNKHITAKTRPLKISEALELHERENEFNPNHKIDGNIKNDESKDKLFPSNEDKLSKFENIKISELHENFLVENLENPKKSARNTFVEDGTDFNQQGPNEVFRKYDKVSEFLTCNDDSPKSNDISKISSPRNDYDSFRGRKSSDGHQRFSISTRNSKKDYIQKSYSKNMLTNSRNSGYSLNDSRKLLHRDYKTNSKNNITKNNPKDASISSSDESLLYSPRSFATPQDSEESLFKNIRQHSNRNYSKDSYVMEKDKQFTRKSEGASSKRDSFSTLNIEADCKSFSDSSLPQKDYHKLNKSLNSKVVPSKSDANDLSRNSQHKFASWNGFQQKNKVLNERFRISCVPSSKDLLKEYNTSHQQALKYAKSCSDFNALVKSPYEYPSGKGANRTGVCLAQQRLLCCKTLNK